MMNSKIYKRDIYPLLLDELQSPYVIIITGSRRTGKTTLLQMLQNEEKVKDNNLYFDLENPIYKENFEQLNFDLIAKGLVERLNNPDKRGYILLDEVQYLSNPAGMLKYMYDHYSNLKFVVSGSSSLKIKSIFSDSMVGRKRVFHLNPLSFSEFLVFKEKNHLLPLTRQINLSNNKIPEINILPSVQSEIFTEFEDYLTYGGYPETTLLKTGPKREQSLFEFYSSYIQKDVSYLFSIENIDKFNKLVKLFASQIGNLVNTSEIANTLNMSRITVDKYASLLQNTFVLDFVRPYYTNIRKELSKMPKIFFEDVGICNAVSGNFDIKINSTFLGNLAENFVYNQLRKKYSREIKFWRTKAKQEVDFILEERWENIPIEVKYTEMQKPKIPGGLRSYISLYKPSAAYVITKNRHFIDKFENTKIIYLPIYLL